MRTLIPVMREILRKCRGYLFGLGVAGSLALMTGCKSEENYNWNYSINSPLARREVNFERNKEGVGNKPEERKSFLVDDKEAEKILREIKQRREGEYRRKASKIEELAEILVEESRLSLEQGFSYDKETSNNRTKMLYSEHALLLDFKSVDLPDFPYRRGMKKEKKGFWENQYRGDNDWRVFLLNRLAKLPKEFAREIKEKTTFHIYQEEVSMLLEPELNINNFGLGVIKKIGIRVKGSPEFQIYANSDEDVMLEVKVRF